MTILMYCKFICYPLLLDDKPSAGDNTQNEETNDVY